MSWEGQRGGGKVSLGGGLKKVPLLGKLMPQPLATVTYLNFSARKAPSILRLPRSKCPKDWRTFCVDFFMKSIHSSCFSSLFFLSHPPPPFLVQIFEIPVCFVLLLRVVKTQRGAHRRGSPPCWVGDDLLPRRNLLQPLLCSTLFLYFHHRCADFALSNTDRRGKPMTY